MAENKPLSLYELGKQGDKQNKAFSEAANKNAQQPTQPKQRGETPEERATYARLMGINDFGALGMDLALSKMDSAKEQMDKSAANVAKLQSKMKPQEHDPLKVDSGRIMQQNITQRAAQKMVDEPTSVEGVEDKSKAAAKYLGYEPYILKPDVQSLKTMRDVFDSTDPLYESQGLAAAFKYIDTLPTNEEGKIVVDGVPYSRMELAQGLAPQIVAHNSGSLFANNATYRDDMAKRMGYKNMDSYLAALDQRLATMQRDLVNHVSAQHAIQTPFNDMAGLEALATQERAGAKVLRDLRDQIKSMRAGEGGFEQFFKGLNEGFDAVNMATFGVADLASEYKQNIVFNKMLNGETLTPEERILADALNIKSDLDALREAQGQSWYNKIGTGVGYIGEIAPQFAGPMLAAKGLFKPINVGAKGAWEMTKKAASKGGFTSAFKTGLGATMRVGDKSLNNIALFQINGMLTAPLQASTYSRFLEKRNAQYSIKDGKVTYKPTDAWRDLVDTWIEQGAEVGSELFGVSLEKFTSASLAAIGRNIGLGKVMRKIGGSVRDVETSKAMRFVKSGATKAGQQLFGYAGGVLPETLSEIYGDLTSEMFKSVLTGNGNFEEFKNPTYWATAFALSGIYGGAISVLPSMVDYVSYMHDMSALGDIKKNALGKIEHTNLKNALIALGAGGSIKDATKHLAELDWKNGGYSLEEIGYAMDYIRAEAMQQVRMGEATESQRLQRFGNVAQNIEAHAYRNEDGMPSGGIVMAVDKDGNSYHILEGNYSNAEATLKTLNSEGNVVPLLASNIEGLSKASIAEVTLFYYQQMFSTEFNMQSLERAEYAIERMDNPTMAQVADVAKRVGIVMPKEGDTITLVDGRTAKVTSISDDLGIMAEMTDGEGNLSIAPIPIMQILSSNTYIAEAQKLQNAEDALEEAKAEEAQAEAEDAVEGGDATAGIATEEVSNGIVGTEVTLPNGNKGTIVEVDGDDVIVDTGRGVDAYEVYSKEEFGITEATETTTPQPTQTTAEQTSSEAATEQNTDEVTPEQATEALNEIAGIKPVPTLEDGSIDYDAIDDAETFAKHFEYDMGSREEAIKNVQEMREQAMADLAEAEKKGKKARSANEKVANKEERQRLAERIAFYDNVLDIYTPKAEAPATPIESAPQVDTTPSQTETQAPAEAAEGVQPSEAIAEEQADGYSKYNENLERQVGLQHNELSKQLEEKTRRLINDVATAFGVHVIFQREVRSSAGNLVNGKIDGSTVYFNWGKREHTLTWLMGHEFTHRMKALSPEAYKKLRDAVRVYLGDEKWNQLIEKQRKIYEERENPEEILSSAESATIWEEAKEQTKREDGSYNTEAAKKLYNKKVAEARREAYIEEVVCDEVGVLARDHKAFDRFLRSEHVRNDGKFLSWLRKVWQSIKNAFSHDARTFNEVMKTLDELIDVSTAKVAKDTQVSNEEKYALAEIEAERLREQRVIEEVNAQYNARLLELNENRDAKKRVLHLGRPQKFLRDAGIVDTEIEMEFDKFIRKSSDNYKNEHPFTAEDILDLPKAINSPIAVFKSTNGVDKVILTEIKKDGMNFIVTIKTVERKRKGGVILEVNEIETLYPKKSRGIVSWINKELASNIDKEKALAWVEALRTNRETELTEQELNRATNVIQIFDLSKVSEKNSLITPEMDAAYMDAVNNGDMETAQQMVMEAAKLAMPNTKIVDEDGNPQVVWHGDRKKARYIFSTDTFFTPKEEYAKRYTNGTGEVYATFLDIKRPFDIRDKKAYDIFTEFRGGRKPVVTTTGAMDWGEYSYEDLQEYVEDVAPNEYDGFILDEGADPDGNGGVEHRGLSFVPFTPNQIKSANPITYDDNGNIIPLSERFNPEKEDIRYSLSEETTQIFDAAKAKFGTTYDMREAGYILPDGSMLDFSGRHQVRGGDTSFLNGDRTVDHREISDIAYDADDNETGISTDLGDFLDRGAIRIDSNAGAINLNVAPTKAQKVGLKRLIERNNGSVYIDFGKGWDTEHYAEYEAARASRVLGDIERYFDEGIKPTGNVRYSLSNRPTGLLNDFTEEFEALQKEYEWLDPTTLHAHHPFRIRKRKVVQKYVNYVSEVLALPCEVFVLDSSNEQQVRTAYRKYVSARLAGGKVSVASYEEFKNEISDAIGEYFLGTNMVIINIGNVDSVNLNSEYIGVVIHENGHKIIKGMNLGKEMFEAIYEESQRLAPKQVEIINKRYPNTAKDERGEELITFALQTRASYKDTKDMLMQFLEGEISVDDILDSFKISLPLRDNIIKNILIAFQDGYNNKHNADYANNRDNYGAAQEETFRNRRGSKYNGDSRRDILTPTRYSLQSGNMPFFNDNGDIITFDNTDITGEDYDAVELRSPMPTTPRTTKDVIKAHLSARHNATKERIRRESRVLRDAVRKQYREEQVRRREGVETMRTNAAKVDYIIGAPIETLDYEAQVLAKIAMGTLSISWESLSKELGVKSGDKKSYRHITNGATATLDAVVHAWWESINGYENGIDTQDLRNALIDVLMQVPTANGALSILEDRFDHALRNRDEALEDIDREEDRLIAEEDARYNEQMTTLSDPARMSEYVRQYEQTVGFHEELTAIEGTLRKMDSELKAVRKRAERAQMRNRASKQKQFDKSKEIIGKQREFYKDKLAEQRASFKEVREAIAEGKRALLEALSTYEQLGFNKQEVRSLVDAVNKARSMADINKVRVKIENVILNVSIREKRRHMDQMLNLRLPSGELVETWVSKQIHDGKMSVADGKRILADMFRGTNANGVRVAKYVDDETARVMDYLRKNLVVPNHGGHYQDKIDADGNVIGREYVPSREVTEGADILMASNEKKMNELLEKKINGNITEEENIELLARQLYTPYLFAANARANVKEVRAEGEKLYEDIQRKKAELGDAYTKEMRDADYAALEANSLHLVEAKTVYDEALTEYNETLGNVIMEGRDNLRMFREGKEAHKAEVVGMAIKAIGGEAKETSDGLTVWERLSRGGRKSIGATYWTFDTACREIDRFAPNGEGEFYKHFMGGWREASNAFFTRTENHVLSICEAVGRITGSGKDSRRALRKFIETADWTDVGKIRYKNGKGIWEETRLKVSNALFVLAMWDQAQYRDIMTKRGVTQEVIDSIIAKIASIDEHYLDFKDWVVQEFLPTTRLEYNEVHKQVFGASMDNIKNYFPAKVVKGYAEEDLNRGEQLLPSTITGSIITRKSHSENIKYNQSFFSVLLNHLQNMDQWASFTPLVEDLTAVLSSPEFSRLANEYKPGVGEDKGGAGSLKQILRETGAIAVGSYTSKADDADVVLRFMTGAWAASNITFRFSTALKQMSGLSAVFTSGLGMTQAYFVKNLFRSIGWAYKNSPMFKKRWGDGVAGNEALLEKYSNRTDIDLKRKKIEHLFDKAKEYLRLLTVNIGMLANRAVDAWVTAVTMRTVYDVTLREITKGKPNTATEEQKDYAMMKAEIFANETQQSSEGAYLSVPQTQRSVVTAAATVYMNAPFAANRMRVQGVQDIYRWLNSDYRNEINTRYGDGAARKAASKGLGRLVAGISIDASFILMSRALGQGLWNLIIDWFDGTEDDDDEAEPINWKEIGLDVAIQIATGGYLGLSQIPSLAGGHRPSLAPSLTELYKGVMNFLGWNEYKLREGDFSIDLYWWALGEIMFKYGLGVDPETMLNIARGIEGICRDKDPMAAMKILNTPQSMVNIIAGPRRDNETAKEYVERRARLEVLFAQPKYSELYDDEGKFIGKGKYDVVGGAKNYRLKSLFKEYNERQRATVMSKYLSPSEVAEFERIDSKYKAVVEPLGWEVGKNPVDDMVDKTGWKNIYPEGLRQEHYAALKSIATAAERTRRAQDRWVGTDKGYADLVREEYNLREQLIAGRRSSYKAKTAKEKIDRAEKQRKKNQKK